MGTALFFALGGLAEGRGTVGVVVVGEYIDGDSEVRGGEGGREDGAG